MAAGGNAAGAGQRPLLSVALGGHVADIVLAMKTLQALRRFISTSWLVAGPLVLLLLLIAVPLLLAIIDAIVGRVFGPDAAEAFFVFWFDAMMWGGELVLIMTPIGLAIYGTFYLARWLVRKKAP